MWPWTLLFVQIKGHAFFMGDNNKIVKIHWRHLRFFSSTAGPMLTWITCLSLREGMRIRRSLLVKREKTEELSPLLRLNTRQYKVIEFCILSLRLQRCSFCRRAVCALQIMPSKSHMSCIDRNLFSHIRSTNTRGDRSEWWRKFV